MKIKIPATFLLLAMFFSSYVNAQIPYSKNYYSPASAWTISAIATAKVNGNELVAGCNYSYGTTVIDSSRIALVKLDSAGQLIWSKTYGSVLPSIVNDVIVFDSALFLLGNVSLSSTLARSYLLKTDFDGNILNEKIFDIGESRVFTKNTSGGITFGLATYEISAFPPGLYITLISVDSNLDTVWAKKYFVGGALNAEWDEIFQTSDGGYILTGLYSFATGRILLKIDGSGNVLWCNAYTTETGLGTETSVLTADGSIVSSGLVGILATLYRDETVKIDSLGTVVWGTRSFVNYTGKPIIRKVIEDSNGNIYTFGMDYNYIFMNKSNASGTSLWCKYYYPDLSSSYNYLTDVEKNSDGGYTLSGTSALNSSVYPSYYSFSFSTDSLGAACIGTNVSVYYNTPPVFTSTPLALIPSGNVSYYGNYSSASPGLSLYSTDLCSATPGVNENSKQIELSVFPNPANDLVSVCWSNKSDPVTDLTLINLMGQTIFCKQLTGAPEKTDFSVASMPAGIYFVLLKTQSGQTYSQKLEIHSNK